MVEKQITFDFLLTHCGVREMESRLKAYMYWIIGFIGIFKSTHVDINHVL